MGKVVTAIIVALAASICCESSRETWYVDGSMIKPGDGSSWDTALKGIQSGIDKAGDGDTVIVAEGTYVENIQFKGKNIVLRSTDPLDPAIVANTIIDGNQAGSVVSFAGSEDDTCALAGFTIRNGNGSNGGGISGSKEWAYGARALLENNLIVDNTALRGGGIAYCDGIIRNNTISGNTATERQYGGGGVHGCDGLIEQNLITDKHQ